MPRRQMTAPVASLPVDDLPELTAQQMGFVEGILEGLTASDAYRKNYSSTTPRYVWAEASRLRSHPGVAAWLSAARKAALDTGRVTLEGHQSELARLREIALDTGNVGAAVQAEVSRGKVQGLYIERFEDVTAKDPMQTIEQIKKIDPALAERLTRQFAPQLIEMQVAGQKDCTEPLCVTVETGASDEARG